ncbi:hypothetical protein UPYG_G00255040 [Umbra pygmaea]|uniref:Uncharacterized protein n=1 Tax=Umbra pygmaea TaxID=75934 RepID=A0ABD0W8B1_UMBPY
MGMLHLKKILSTLTFKYINVVHFKKEVQSYIVLHISLVDEERKWMNTHKIAVFLMKKILFQCLLKDHGYFP